MVGVFSINYLTWYNFCQHLQFFLVHWFVKLQSP